MQAATTNGAGCGTLAGKMDDRIKQKEAYYLRWLLAVCTVGALTGWIVQALMIERFIWWALPAFLVACICFTFNGDNVIESVVLLLILGVVVLLMGRSTMLTRIIGTGTMVGGYVALAVSKLGFAMAKGGAFGNRPLS